MAGPIDVREKNPIAESPPEGDIPIADEASPGLGRNGGYWASERQQSGGLDDDPVDGNPVVNSQPIRQAGGRR